MPLSDCVVRLTLDSIGVASNRQPTTLFRRALVWTTNHHQQDLKDWHQASRRRRMFATCEVVEEVSNATRQVPSAMPGVEPGAVLPTEALRHRRRRCESARRLASPPGGPDRGRSWPRAAREAYIFWHTFPAAVNGHERTSFALVLPRSQRFRLPPSDTRGRAFFAFTRSTIFDAWYGRFCKRCQIRISDGHA